MREIKSLKFFSVNTLQTCFKNTGMLLFSQSVLLDSVTPWTPGSPPGFPVLHHLLGHAQTHLQ